MFNVNYNLFVGCKNFIFVNMKVIFLLQILGIYYAVYY